MNQDHRQLFLLAGQSNMAGRGKVEPDDARPHPRIYILDRQDQWSQSGEPIHFDKPQAGVGPGFTFAKRLVEDDPAAVVGLIPCAVGGSDIAEWQPGATLYENAVRRAKIATASGQLRAVLWHQGEASCSEEAKADVYAESLAGIIQRLRQDLGTPDVPFIAGQIGEYLYTRTEGRSPFARTVNAQIDRLPTLVSGVAVVSSQGLRDAGDELHFDAASQREFGMRYYDAYRALM